FLVQDGRRNIGVGTSTSGWPFKYPGRLGDSPVVGAGAYADSSFGAAACTHTGEMTLRAGTARSILLHLQAGLDLEAAVGRAVDDLLSLREGLLGEVTIFAIDNRG